MWLLKALAKEILAKVLSRFSDTYMEKDGYRYRISGKDKFLIVNGREYRIVAEPFPLVDKTKFPPED